MKTISTVLLSALLLTAGGIVAQPGYKKINIDNSADSRLYQSVAIKGGWAAAGRVVLKDSDIAEGLVYIHFKTGADTVIRLRAGDNCRLYTVIGDTDTTFITAGYRGVEDGSVCAFFARWHNSGRMIDTATHCLGGGAFNIVSDLEKDAEGQVYAWCKSGSREKVQPHLLRLGAGLEINATPVDLAVSARNVQGKLQYIPGENSLAYVDFNDTTAVMGKLDLQGRPLLPPRKVQAKTWYYNLLQNEPYAGDYLYDVDPFELQWHNGYLYLTGTMDRNVWVAKFNTALELQQSHQLYNGATIEEAGRLFFNRDGAWLSVASRVGGSQQDIHRMILFDDTLQVEAVVNTGIYAAMINGFAAGEDEVVVTGLTEVPGGNTEASFAGIHLSVPARKTFNVTWEGMQGPPGADATAFTIDENGDYWLGTGSSGGVYVSQDRGQRWKPVLKGLGAMHITALLRRQDTVWARVEDMRLRELLGNDHEGPAFFYLTGRERKWKWQPYADRLRIRQIEHAIRQQDTRLFNQYQERYPLRRSPYTYSRLMQYYKGFGVDFGNESFDLYTHEVSNRMAGFYNIDSATRSFNAMFPPDVFEVGRNIDLDGNRLILLSKSGPWFSDDNRTLYPAPRKGLIATDVRLVRERKNKDVIALVGTQEIWRYRGGEWTLLFTTARQPGKDTMDVGVDIPGFDIGADDQVVFSFGSDIWAIDRFDSARLVLGHGNHFNEPKGNVNLFAGTSVPGGSYLLVGVSAKGNEFELYQYDTSGLRKLRGFGSPQFSFPYTDKTGNTWILGDSIYRWDASAGSLIATLPRVGPHFYSGISSNHNGEVVILSHNLFLTWQPRERYWMPQIVAPDQAAITHYSGQADVQYNSIAIDDQGQVYFGTGPTYSVSCGFSIDGYPAGVFAFDGYQATSLLNPINNWIYALEAVEGGLLVGTSGSGVIRAAAGKKKKKGFWWF
ncbi:MAG TPA: hypothetical protein VF145_12930 [Chitinophagaceae bacterium]